MAQNFVGGRAVIFFYRLVSGFLISYRWMEGILATAAGTLAYLRSRFLRIFPLWWALFYPYASADSIFRSWPTTHPSCNIVFRRDRAIRHGLYRRLLGVSSRRPGRFPMFWA